MTPSCTSCGRLVCCLRGNPDIVGCRDGISHEEGRLLGQHETRDRLVSIRYHGRRCD